MTSWLVVLGVGLGSYLFRLVPLAIGEQVARSDRVQRIVHHAGTAALTALVVTSLLHVASAASAGTGGATPGALLTVALAALASTLVAIRGRSMLAVVAAGSACYLVADLAHRALVA